MDISQLKRIQKAVEKQAERNYPCDNQNIICGIITDDFQKAKEYISFLNIPVEKKICSKKESQWILKNNEIWVWLRPEVIKDRQGLRLRKVAIDRNINDKPFLLRNILSIMYYYCCYMDII